MVIVRGNVEPQNSTQPPFVNAVQPPGKTTRFGDGNGLYVVAIPSGGTGGKSCVQRLTVNGVVRELGFRSARDVTLREARRRALRNRRTARAGGDPSPRRPGVPTFAEAFDVVIALRRATWKDPVTMAARWRTSMERYARGRLGTLSVGRRRLGPSCRAVADLGTRDEAQRIEYVRNPAYA